MRFSFVVLLLFSACSKRNLKSEALRFNNNNNAAPEVSSTLLRVHRMYTSHPPHDESLYNTLRVSPNATTAEIQKSYRKLSRQWHPDKQRHNHHDDDAQEQLEKVQHAYDILHKDATRLLYHRYGLQDVSTAVLILTGYQNTPKVPPQEYLELLQLMGYYVPRMDSRRNNDRNDSPPPPRSLQEVREQRVRFLAATTVERIRPLVEGTLSPELLVDAFATECDRIKKLPLGSQIIRCVGRAYRHAGQHHMKLLQQQQQQQVAVQKHSMRDRWHDAKHVLTAAVASGRVVLNENWLLKATTPKLKTGNKPSIAYHQWEDNRNTIGGLLDNEESSSDDEEEAIDATQLQQLEAIKAKQIMVELSQVEALWKVHKIGLDRSVREACAWIMSGRYFFFPSHQQQSSSSYDDHESPVDGWVSSSPKQQYAIDSMTARWKAASALVLIGNVMVHSSKEGTSWME
ncbi:protein DnaJ [Seminavis robusta]|uniref:Protein DnaJ n=1 Tax=Seminavis robusta TaxID=568900 RepID=A0A9N8DNQ7_9STRA|nr:protein DnaJ [Seminavis robusta]|eukprot:Sro157_g071020.1 protein DnaJ (458) ;mRNA; f:9925-11298